MEKLRREGRAEATLTKVEWLLSLAIPDLGSSSVKTIRPIEILDVLRKVEKRGRYDTARRLRSTAGAVFRYAIATARAEIIRPRRSRVLYRTYREAESRRN